MTILTLGKECSTVLPNKILKKEKDWVSFIIPCTIEGVVDEKALDNLGVSINLIPYKIF